VELEWPSAFSELIGRRVTDSSGRSLGHVFEISAHWERDGTIVFDELLLGRRALLGRLRGPAQRCRGIPWETIIEVRPERIVVKGWCVTPPPPCPRG
jgi:sporulation protein YlmC with PRC-barrel domain